ncbi:MAG: methylated-DNA--[protein]-cysteine S-methyltransferase [Planctomycetia bacterium]|nr:methylated-DNA--[protein]-cysteine S-methyltransferase [Planctomycetia bacterium]
MAVAFAESRRKTARKRQALPLSATVFPTELGWMALARRGEVVCSLSFGHESPKQALAALPGGVDRVVEDAGDGLDDSLVHRLTDFAAGKPVDFSDVKIDLSHLTPFQREVVQRCRRIPRGRTISYGRLAARCGVPLAARAVGNVMAQNRTPLIVPCHRVVASGGRLGEFSAPGGPATKRRLLELEQS